MKRSILLLISALVIGMSASAQTSGTIEGTSINWVVSDYTLEIVGNGSEAESIPTYSSQSSVPWYNYHTQINILRLSGNIKSIGKYAFYALTSMTKIYCSISTPPTLQSNTFNTSNLSSIALLVSSEEMQSSYMSAQYWMQMSVSVDPEAQTGGTLSDNAYLTAIYIDGSILEGFDSQLFNYQVSLPTGTTNMPDITYTTGDPGQVVTVDQPSLDNPEAKITVMSPDGTMTNTYFISFTIGNTGSDPMSGTLVNGQNWSLTDGQLKLTGAGYIAGFSSPDEAPWYEHRSEVNYLFLGADFYSIGEYVFYDMPSLTTISCPSSSMPTLEANTFSPGMLSQITATVRADLLSQYQADPYWSQMSLETYPDTGGDTGGSNPVSGTLGDDITWVIYPDKGTLEISGYGEMPATGTNTSPWADYVDMITTVDVGSGIETICDYAFSGLGNLQEIHLPSTLMSIGDYAFDGCTGLYSIRVLTEEEVPVLGNGVFDAELNLGSVALYVLESMFDSFAGTDVWMDMNLQIYKAPIAGVDDYGSLGEAGIEWFVMNSGTTLKFEGMGSIPAFTDGSVAPWNNYINTISEVILTGDNITGIDAYAFASYPKLASVVLPEWFTGIGSGAFSNCMVLSVIEIKYEEEVVTLGDDVFNGVDMAEITLYVPDALVAAYQSDPTWGQMEVHGASDKPIYGSVTQSISWSISGSTLNITGLGGMPDYMDGTDAPWYDYYERITDAVVGEGITYIGNNTFAACTNLTSATFPRTTDSIGINIFSNHDQSFTLNLGAFIPPGITDESFSNVAGQLYIYVWQSLWGLYGNTPIWMNLMINSNDNPSDIDAMDVIDNQFVWYISGEVLHLLGRGALPNYTEAPDQPWYDYRSNIYKIYMNASSITQIGSYAFEGCNLVNEVVLPATLTYAGNRAFGDCTGLVELNACAVEDEYGFACDADAFAGVDMSAVTMRVPGSMQQASYSGTEIFSACMFELCDSGGSDPEDKLLDSGECGPDVYWELYESGKLIIKGNSYIYGYTYYEDIPWYNYRSQINTVEVQEGVQSLTKAAFFDCVQMDSITLPASLCCIDDSTFYNCVALRTIVCTRDNPPSVNGTDPFGNVALSAITLYVPEGSGAMYSYADYWKQMQIVERGSSTSQLEPYQLEYIFVNSIGISDFNPSIYNYDITLPANSEAPRISYMSGNIDQTVEIEQPASANGTGYIHVSVDGVRMATYTLNFTSEITRAIVGLSHKWKFIMLPSMFGLNESDVTADAELQWATYDGEKRAAGQEGWNMEDIEMAYYKDWGHIVRATGDTATLTINLPANLNTTSATIQLRKHPSSHEENKNWCLIGNPYNAEYRSEGLMAAGITSSIHVWNGVGYSTFDPEFDSYAIQPFEAFFVQLPDDAPESITLSPEYIVGYNNGGNTGGDPDEGTLSGYFSIAEGAQVRFSKGNLQYYPSKDIWRFAENQYDTIGIYNTNISTDYDGWIDLFGWGTGANPTLATQNNEDYSTFTDWGTNAISNGGSLPGLWRTLTNDEWAYLIQSRERANELYGFANVNEVNGLILLPDGWNEISHYIAITTGTGDYSQNTLTIDDWNSLEEEGAVFLPAAGTRSGREVTSIGSDGYYWSSTQSDVNSIYAENLYFSIDGIVHDGDMCFGGGSVRLVHE